MRAAYYRKNRTAAYYRALAMRALHDAGMSRKSIADFFLLSTERVRQILKAGPRPAQLELPK